MPIPPLIPPRVPLRGSTTASQVYRDGGIGPHALQVELRVKDPPTGHIALAVAGDRGWIKAWTGTALLSCKFVVDAVQDPGAGAGYYIYVCHRTSNTGAGTFPAGTAVSFWGPASSGFISLSSDGTIGAAANISIGHISPTAGDAGWNGGAGDLVLDARLGNLNGAYGYAVDTIGIGMGAYGVASGAAITIDTTSGIRIINNTTVIGQWDTSGNITLGNVANNQGNAYWNNTTKQLQFRGSTNGTVVQAYIDTDGSLAAAGGKFKVDSNGVTFATNASAYTWWKSGTTIAAQLQMSYASGTATWTHIIGVTGGGGDGELDEWVGNSQGHQTRFELHSIGGTDNQYANLYSSATLTGFLIGTTGVPNAMLDVRGDISLQPQANGQLLEIRSLTELTTIAAAATTDTAIQIPLGAIVLAVSVRVTVAIPTAGTFGVHGTTSNTQFDRASGVSTNVNSTDLGTLNCPYSNGAAQTIRFIPNVTPANNTGRVRVTIHYINIVAPTS